MHSMLKVAFGKNFLPKSATIGGQFHLNIQFEVSGGLTVLFGPSGCGKSSTLQAIAGLLHPDWGRIEVAGTIFLDTKERLNLPAHRRNVGYVFQNCALFGHLNVAENIGFALNRWQRHRRQQRINELVKLLELEDLVHQPVQKISGGQAQRVAIARALAPYPKILLLDEPFSALDDDLRATLRSELKTIQRQFNLPVVLVTHSRADALELADSLAILAAGQVVAVGQAEHLLDSRSYSIPGKFQWG